MSVESLVPLEVGRTIRWRGQRWRILGLDDGFARLVGIDQANDGLSVSPLLQLEQGDFAPDVPGVFPLEVERTARPRWRAMHQAYLATMVGGRERLVGLDWGAIAVEPYQLVPLMRSARHASPRLLIADDTGLGKTAEAGLVLRYLAQRHRAGRVLVVTRAAPDPGRWRRELWLKFGLRFDVLRDGTDFLTRRRAAPTVNVFAQEPRLIAPMTLLSRQVFLDELRQAPPYDVVIVDEAHNVAQRGSGTKRLVVLARELARKSSEGALLLLTATPHDGKTESFMSLLRLLDPHIELRDGRVATASVSRLIVRRLKREVELSGGRRFIEPAIQVRSTIPDASAQEKALEPLLDAYLEHLREREAAFASEAERAKAKGCSFLASILLKRTGSSVAALRATLRRRLGLPPDEEDADAVVAFVDTDASDPEDDDLDPSASQVTPPPDMDVKEAGLARALLEEAERVPRGRDAKLQHLSKLLNNELTGCKVVVFTEYRDTLRAARRRLDADGVSSVTFHGGSTPAEREHALSRFQHDPGVRVFLATDAGSEGQNLQHSCHDLVHLDVPWNPNRYEQRNGRIDRYGQREQPRIWALVAADRRKHEGRPEFRALEVVLDKLSTIAHELGSVGPVLPALAGDRVRDLLARAGRDAERKAEELVDEEALDRASGQLNRLTVQNEREIGLATALVEDLGTVDDFQGRVQALLVPAFRGWVDGGKIEDIEPGIVRIEIPRRLRRVLDRDTVPRATYRRDVAVGEADEDREDPAELLSPGHPLVEAVAQALREESMDSRFEHRFDVAADSSPALVLSFLARYGDGEGRTVEERLDAVAVEIDGAISDDPQADLARLALDGQPGDIGPGARPDPSAIAAWQQEYDRLVPLAQREAESRALHHVHELTEAARRIYEEELSALALWKRDQEERIDADTIGLSAQISFDTAAAFEQRRAELDGAYERRVEALRDQSMIQLTSVDLIGGLLLVSPAP
jgi:superfamily II DNA or RNA helicase